MAEVATVVIHHKQHGNTRSAISSGSAIAPDALGAPHSPRRSSRGGGDAELYEADEFHYGEQLGDMDAHDLAQMLSIGGVSSAEQAAIAENLIATYDEDGNMELDEEEQLAFKKQLHEGIGPVDAMFDANAQIMQPSVVLQAIQARAVLKVERRKSYAMLFWFLVNFFLYLVVLAMQRAPSSAFAVETAVKGALFTVGSDTVDQTDNRIARDIPKASTFYEWLDSNILQTVFIDPTCGDSICEVLTYLCFLPLLVTHD